MINGSSRLLSMQRIADGGKTLSVLQQQWTSRLMGLHPVQEKMVLKFELYPCQFKNNLVLSTL